MAEAKLHQRIQTLLALIAVSGLFMHLGQRNQQLDQVVIATENLTKAVGTLQSDDLVKEAVLESHDRRITNLEVRK